jgi:hypothetical protein
MRNTVQEAPNTAVSPLSLQTAVGMLAEVLKMLS